ncbi:hypothetical protein HDU93_003775 [Gonapodya sp. JEL0774]|nr:hypothetical protein HDU93_003775 [Gonapodya sp. JEL0774]
MDVQVANTGLGGHGHDHDGDDGPDRGNEQTLFKHIDVDNVRALNADATPPSDVKSVFKPWDQRFDTEKFVSSDADDQLIVHIPFTGSVKVKSIAVLGAGDHAPAKMNAFINRPDLDFSSCESTVPDQSWELPRPEWSVRDIVECQTRMTKFQNIRHLTLFFPSAHDADTLRITYIGLKGEWFEIKRDPIITLYELSPNPADHAKVKAEQGLGSTIL